MRTSPAGTGTPRGGTRDSAEEGIKAAENCAGMGQGTGNRPQGGERGSQVGEGTLGATATVPTASSEIWGCVCRICWQRGGGGEPSSTPIWGEVPHTQPPPHSSHPLWHPCFWGDSHRIPQPHPSAAAAAPKQEGAALPLWGTPLQAQCRPQVATLQLQPPRWAAAGQQWGRWRLGCPSTKRNAPSTWFTLALQMDFFLPPLFSMGSR